MSAVAPTLQSFFTDRLTRQRHASAHTIAAYRDALRLLLNYAASRTGIAPSQLDLADLDAPLIGGFLDHLEHERGNSVRTRNTRLAAIHSLFRFAALAHPEHAETISRVLAIPPKRFDHAVISYLSEAEVDALLAACDQTTWTGRRDHTILLLAVQTGLRVSELIGLRSSDVHLGTGAHVACRGKGRKDRITPLTASTTEALRNWLAEQAGNLDNPLFPTRRGASLSRDAIEHRLAVYTSKAAQRCPSLHGKKVTAHVLRHTTAMRPVSTPASTPASSRYGWDTSASTPLRSTCTPTSSSRRKHSLAPVPRTVEPGDTSHPTASSPGSKPSDYADLASQESLHRKGSTINIGIIRTSA